MKITYLITLVFVLTAWSSCKKEDSADDNGIPAGGDSGVYAVYSTGGQWRNRTAFLWKDGVQTDYSNKNPAFSTSGTNLYLTAIAVSTTGDVYVAGGEALKERQDFPTPNFVDSVYTVIWKNGVKQYLNSTPLTRWFMKGQDVDLALNSNDDVFVLGRDGADDAGDYSVWKNGTRIIEINGGEPGKLFVKGDDVYLCGDSSNHVVLWKNGVKQVFNAPGIASSLFVSDNNDVYVGDYGGKIFKNSVEQSSLVSSSGNSATRIEDIFCKGNDVYVLGIAHTEKIIWKNASQLYKLTSPVSIYPNMYIQSLFVSGGDVYVSAVLYNSTTSSGGPSAAVLFKNGELYKTMFDGNGLLVDAPSVFVK